MFSRRRLLAAGALAPMAGWPLASLAGEKTEKAASPATAPNLAPPTLEELLRPSLLTDVALSPDGSRVAVLNEKRVGKKRDASITLSPADNLEAPGIEVPIGDFDVEQVEWANNERLLIWISMTKDSKGKPTGLTIYDTFIPIRVRRIMSINLDATQGVVLFNNQPKAFKRDFNLGDVVDRIASDPRCILMQKWDSTREVYCLYRVDVYTGDAVEVERGVSATDGWYAQDGVPVLRFDSNMSGTTFSVFGRPPGATEWKLIRKTRRNELKRYTDLDIVGATKEPGVLLISHRAPGENFKSVRTFDVRTLTMGEPVGAVPDRDLTDVFTDENAGLVAINYLDERQSYKFIDPTLAPHFRGVNSFFGKECNVRLYDVNQGHDRFLVQVSGPRQPGMFAFYNVKTKHLNVLGEQKPWLNKERLARMETLKVKCRDGVEITAYLTIPNGESTGPRPMVVMPHGGPELRDSYDYDLWAQALATRGWLVLQPNFRGSGGYGKAFGDAGRKRWGDRMQEDIEDAVAQVLASGKADPARLAIFGASYGGYAALMGVVLKPKLYRCAVGVAGDYDLQQSLAFARREDGSDSESYAYWRASMGDPKLDKVMLAAASPRLRVNEIEVPILLIHGSDDDIVTPESSRSMDKALKKAGKPHEFIELKDVGHRGWSRKTTTTVLSNTIRFIAAAFGEPAPKAEAVET